ncbi:MAG: AarF/ABC1/UbiB kinase family protein [Candidatus Levybacteria bacterium]|nr:AarF/ABC1/UbiB kinase family protein [Candidatus Levybacteria bacterium]
MFRFLYIISLLTKYFFIYSLLRLNLYKKPKQKILRNFFEEAGGSFIKFGQLLALRVDVLPKEYALEMIGLFDNVKPFPYEDVERIFLQELGATPQKIFKDFQKIPFASASFGQVHGAKLENDHIVAVKVMRPGIEEKVLADFLLIDILAFFADLFFKIEALPWMEFAKEFKRWTKIELNYEIEAENMRRMYKNASVNKNIVIPKVYPQISTKKILVEDYIEGIPLSRVLLGLKDGRLTPEKLEKMGIDIKKVPSVFTQEFLREFFMDDIFHADPHPGNILILKDNKLALLDFGIIGKTITYNKASFVKSITSSLKDKEFRDLRETIFHFANFSSEELKSIIGSALPANTSQKRLEEILNLLSEHFSETVYKMNSTGRKELELMKKDYAVYYLEIMKAGQKYKVKLPAESVLFIRVLSITGFLSKHLNYNYKLAEEMREFLKIHPEETLLDENDYAPLFKRINREQAIEKLNNWLAYLIEIDPPLYKLVKEKFKEYNSIDS